MKLLFLIIILIIKISLESQNNTIPEPILSGISPLGQPISTSLILNITGRNFQNTTCQCRFGKRIVTICSIKTSSLLSCITPVFTEPFSSLIEVRFGNDTYIESPRLFIIYNVPEVTIFPKYAMLDSIIPLEIELYGSFRIEFRQTTFCKFKDISVEAKYSLDFIICILPEFNTSETVMVYLSFNGGETYNETESLFIFEEPMVESIHPNKGRIEGMTKISIRGQKFFNSSNIFCRFGRLPAVKGEYITNNEITCVTPDARDVYVDNSSVPLLYSMNGVEYSDHDIFFYYYSYCPR
jgi:hypothetical protein